MWVCHTPAVFPCLVLDVMSFWAAQWACSSLVMRVLLRVTVSPHSCMLITVSQHSTTSVTTNMRGAQPLKTSQTTSVRPLDATTYMLRYRNPHGHWAQFTMHGLCILTDHVASVSVESRQASCTLADFMHRRTHSSTSGHPTQQTATATSVTVVRHHSCADMCAE